MAIRFMDTNFYKSPFVRSLPGPLKSLYTFIICDCSGAGIWTVDLEVAGLYTGFSYEKSQFEKHFVETKKAFDLQDGKYFFPDFIEHQYPSGLQTKNPAHRNFIKELQKYNLLTEDGLNGGAIKGLSRPLCIGNGNSIGDSNSNTEPKNKKEPPSEDEFLAYCQKEISNYEQLVAPLKAKYKAWRENEWKDGYNKPIKNWKTKVLNTVSFLKPDTSIKIKHQPPSFFQPKPHRHGA